MSKCIGHKYRKWNGDKWWNEMTSPVMAALRGWSLLGSSPPAGILHLFLIGFEAYVDELVHWFPGSYQVWWGCVGFYPSRLAWGWKQSPGLHLPCGPWGPGGPEGPWNPIPGEPVDKSRTGSLLKTRKCLCEIHVAGVLLIYHRVVSHNRIFHNINTIRFLFMGLLPFNCGGRGEEGNHSTQW